MTSITTTAYLEDFLKVLLYRHEIELKNRFLRIGFEYGSKGTEAVARLHRKEEELDIDKGKLDIGGGKLDIRTLSAPTKANVKKLYAEFGKTDYFKRSDALKVLSLTPTAVSNLLAKMHQLGILEPVAGHGKGAWRFSNAV